MNTPLRYDEELALLRAEARRWLDERFPIARVRALADADAGEDPGDWKELAALGWLGLCVPEKYGGAGLGALHLSVLMEETGRRLLPSPLLPATLAALALAQSGSEAQRERWLRSWVAGESRPALALGRDAVWGGALADVLVARRGDRFALVPARAPGARIEPEVVLDRTRRSARVDLDAVALDAAAFLPASGAEVLERLTPWACLALAAEMAGGADALLALTSAYTATREQFGKPIGSFQAVKHPLVNVLIGVEGLRSLVYAAATALDDGSPDAEALARMAKAKACDVYVFAASRAVQLHGGFGFTLDCDAHLYLKRAQTTRPAFGDAMHQRRWLAETLLGAAP
ncbi:MAG TPA: acyl-CoA dehydrogenase family protein [Myxococcota bacterium]|nr:acyl-CoA dehydrogenase family protein [Myxococcota bacterium]